MLWWAGTVTLTWTALWYWASPELRKPSLLLIVPVMAAYGYGASALINMQLDTNASEVFTTRVLGKHVTSGRSRFYYLDVAPWGPRTGHNDVTVTSGFYERTREGSTVCVYLYPGALHARWYEASEYPRE